MRIVLDTNLLVRAAITPGGLAHEILRLIEADADRILILSPYLLSEVADVLRRDRIRARWPLTDQEIHSYCQYLTQVGEEVSPQALPPVIQDLKDQAIIETAVAGAATILCTFDIHFYDAPVLEFCGIHGIRVVNDVQFIHLLRTG